MLQRDSITSYFHYIVVTNYKMVSKFAYCIQGLINPAVCFVTINQRFYVKSLSGTSHSIAFVPFLHPLVDITGRKA